MPFHFAEHSLEPASSPPRNGEHTRAVLGENGYDEETITELLDAGVVGDSA